MPTLLAFIPHPDDESYSFAGTIALAAKAGWECIIECASYGERGKRHDGGPTTPDDVAEARESELRASCELLGIAPPNFWGLPDGEMHLHRGEHQRIERLFARLQPELSLTLGSDGAYGHPDHLALHRWVSESWHAFPNRNPLLYGAFPKGLFLPQWEKVRNKLGEPPNPPPEAIGVVAGDYEVPISTVRAIKLASIAAHRSQLPDGDPRSMFPPGIVDALLETEHFTDASGAINPDTVDLLATFHSAQESRGSVPA